MPVFVLLVGTAVLVTTVVVATDDRSESDSSDPSHTAFVVVLR